jgi:hypothetical protein
MFIGLQELIVFTIVALCLYFAVVSVQFYGIGLINVDIYLMFYCFMTFNIFLFRKNQII